MAQNCQGSNRHGGTPPRWPSRASRTPASGCAHRRGRPTLHTSRPALPVPNRSFAARTSPAGPTQGHSILITSDSAICQDAVEIHGVAPEGVGDVVDLIEPQDVEGEAAQDGQDGRALADAAGVLVHGNVQYVVDPVLHAPMAARRGSIMLGAGALAGRCIPCNFAGALPFPANGDILALNPAGEANRLDDVGAPLRKVENAACAEYFEDALFLAVAPYFAALHMAIIRLVPDR